MTPDEIEKLAGMVKFCGRKPLGMGVPHGKVNELDIFPEGVTEEEKLVDLLLESDMLELTLFEAVLDFEFVAERVLDGDTPILRELDCEFEIVLLTETVLDAVALKLSETVGERLTDKDTEVLGRADKEDDGELDIVAFGDNEIEMDPEKDGREEIEGDGRMVVVVFVKFRLILISGMWSDPEEPPITDGATANTRKMRRYAV